MAIKDIFNRAAKNVANTAATEWSLKHKTLDDGDVENEVLRKKTIGEAIREALKEQDTKPMEAYQRTYNMLTQVNRSRPRFRGAMVSTGMRIPSRPGQSGFKDIAVKDPRLIAKENRDRMRKFVLEKAYISKG
jgi:hypothetical protein